MQASGVGGSSRMACRLGRGCKLCGVCRPQSVTSSLSPQEPQRHQQRADGTCHCPLHLPPRPHFWILHPSGLQTSASPSELQVSKDQNTGGVGGRVVGKGLISMFCSGVVRHPHLLFPSPAVKRTQIWPLAHGRAKVFLISLSLKALLSPAFVIMLFPMTSPARNPVPGSATMWGRCHQPDSNKRERWIQRATGGNVAYGRGAFCYNL